MDLRFRHLGFKVKGSGFRLQGSGVGVVVSNSSVHLLRCYTGSVSL